MANPPPAILNRQKEREPNKVPFLEILRAQENQPGARPVNPPAIGIRPPGQPQPIRPIGIPPPGQSLAIGTRPVNPPAMAIRSPSQPLAIGTKPVPAIGILPPSQPPAIGIRPPTPLVGIQPPAVGLASETIPELILEFEGPLGKSGGANLNFNNILSDFPGYSTISQDSGNQEHIFGGGTGINQAFYNKLTPELAQYYQLKYLKNNPQKNIIIPLNPDNQTRIKAILYTIGPDLSQNRKSYGKLESNYLSEISEIYESAINNIIQYNSGKNKLTDFRLAILADQEFAAIQPDTKNLYTNYISDIAMASLSGIFSTIFNQNKYLNKIKIPGYYYQEFVLTLVRLGIIYSEPNNRQIIINSDGLRDSEIKKNWIFNTRYYYPHCLALIKNNKSQYLCLNINGHIIYPNNSGLSVPNILSEILNQIFIADNNGRAALNKIYSEFNFIPNINYNLAIFEIPEPPIIIINNKYLEYSKNIIWSNNPINNPINPQFKLDPKLYQINLDKQNQKISQLAHFQFYSFINIQLKSRQTGGRKFIKYISK